MKALVVVQPAYTGHRLRYVRDVIEGAPGPVILITCRAAVQTAEYKTLLDASVQSGKLRIATFQHRSSEPAALTREARRLICAQENVQHVIFLDVDSYLAAAILIGTLLRTRGVRSSALLMRTPSYRRVPNTRLWTRNISKVIAVRLAALAPAPQLFFLSDSFGAVRRREGYGSLQPIADPPLALARRPRVEARERLGVCDDETVLGLFGSLDETKYVDVILEAASRMRAKTHVIVAGPYNEWTSKQLSARASDFDITMDRRFLEDGELAWYLSACDVVVIAYDRDIPSGFAVTAALSGVWVISAGSRWLAAIVKASNCGQVVPLDADSLASALNGLRESPRNPARPNNLIRIGSDISFAQWVATLTSANS